MITDLNLSLPQREQNCSLDISETNAGEELRTAVIYSILTKQQTYTLQAPFINTIH